MHHDKELFQEILDCYDNDHDFENNFRIMYGICTGRIAWICVQLKNNCMSNSRVIARGEAECNFDCYEYNYYSLIARKYMRLPTN